MYKKYYATMCGFSELGRNQEYLSATNKQFSDLFAQL